MTNGSKWLMAFALLVAAPENLENPPQTISQQQDRQTPLAPAILPARFFAVFFRSGGLPAAEL